MRAGRVLFDDVFDCLAFGPILFIGKRNRGFDHRERSGIGGSIGSSDLTESVCYLRMRSNKFIGLLQEFFGFGNADSVTVISKSAALADSWATSLANRIKSASDIQKTIESAFNINGVIGVVIIADDKIGFAGKINILKV